jgi:hypothetical protein
VSGRTKIEVQAVGSRFYMFNTVRATQLLSESDSSGHFGSSTEVGEHKCG